MKTGANYTCFNSLQNRLACRAGKTISLLPAPARELALTTSNIFVGMVSDVGNSALQLIIRYLSACPIDTTNDKTMAKSFYFRLYYP